MRFVPLFLLLAAPAIPGTEGQLPRLQQIRKVYLLPMAAGLDQYLAERLTTAGLFEVVTDPQKAEAVIAESVGEGLQEKLEEIYPSAQASKKDRDEKDLFGKPAHRTGGFSRGRGTVFIVDRTTRSVLWSMYRPVKSTRPDDTNRRAGDIVKQIQKSLKPEKK